MYGDHIPTIPQCSDTSERYWFQNEPVSSVSALNPTTFEQLDFTLMTLPESALAKRLPRSKKHGHAAPPGTGPDGERCGTCEHAVRKVMARSYVKCYLSRARWTGGYGTDVRLRDPACRMWEKIVEHAVIDEDA